MRNTDNHWSDDIFAVLRDHGVAQVAYVPDAGHSRLIDRCIASNEITTVPLTTEEEGMALLGGAWLGGQRGAMLMQSSGVGNCINMLAFTRTCRFPLLMLVTMRGQYGEFNPWQVPMGQATGDVLSAMDTLLFPADEPAKVGPAVEAAARMAFEGPASTAVLIAQGVIGAKTFGR